MPLRVQYVATPDFAASAHGMDVRGPFRVAGASSVILDTIKRSDDDDFLSSKASQSVICRLYESMGGHARASLVTTLPVKKATIVDLLERHIEDLELVSSQNGKTSVRLPFRGFQIITVKLELYVSKIFSVTVSVYLPSFLRVQRRQQRCRVDRSIAGNAL